MIRNGTGHFSTLAVTIAATTAATVTPEVQAAQETARFTHDLAIYTGALALATLLSIVASITIQIFVTRRDDRLRREATMRDDRLRREAAEATEQARRQQYEHSEKLQHQDHARAREAEERAHRAARELMIVILKAYERYMTLLIAVPLHNVAAPIATAQNLFERAFAGDMVQAIPSALRTELYEAIVTAHEALNYAQMQQAIHTEITEALTRDGEQQPAGSRTVSGTQESDDKRRAREAQLAAVFPAIKESAERAKSVLSKARAALGDTSGPLPSLMSDEAGAAGA
ncbi:MAG: hypothetical protein ACXWNK_12470 [Vulcanimicrobiaceae bacterium]